MKYLFKTTVTMKEYNRKKWWTDPDVICNFSCEANSVEEATKKYVAFVNDRSTAGVTISKTAMETKKPMYRDGEEGQVGYVITGKAYFQNDETYTWTQQYVDLWVSICTIGSAFTK